MPFEAKSELEEKSGVPPWARNNPKPCDCGHCFFCEHGHTAGIQHKQTVRTQRPKLVQCTGEREKIRTWQVRCKVCTERTKADPNMTKEQRQTHLNNKKTYLGCAACDVVVCSECWPSYAHDMGNQTLPPDE